MEGAHTGVAGTIAGPGPPPGPRLSSKAILLMVMKEGLHGAAQLLAKCLLLGVQVARRLAAWVVTAGAQVPGVLGSGMRYALSTRAGKWAVGLAVGLAFVRLSLVRRSSHGQSSDGVITQLNSELSLLFGMLRLQGSLTLKLGPPHFGGSAALHGGDSPAQPQGVDELRISCPQGLKEHIVRFLESQSARNNGDLPAFQLSPHPHTHAHAAASRPHTLAADDSAHRPSLHHYHHHHTATIKPGVSCTGLDSPAPTPANWVFQSPFGTDHLGAIPAAITALGLSAQGDCDPTSILSLPKGVDAALPAAPVLQPVLAEPLDHGAMSSVGKPAWSVGNANGGAGGMAEAVAVPVPVPAAGGAVGAADLGPIAAAVAGTAAAAASAAASHGTVAAVLPTMAAVHGGVSAGEANGAAEALALHGSSVGEQEQAAAGGVPGRSTTVGGSQATEAPNTGDTESSAGEQQERGQQQQLLQVPGARTAAPATANSNGTTSTSHAPPSCPTLPSTATGGIKLDQSSHPIAIGSTPAVANAAATATSAPVPGARQQPSRPLAAAPRTQQQQPYPHAHNYYRSPSHSSTFHSPAFLATLGPSYADEGPLDDRDEFRSLLVHAATYKPCVAGSSPRAKPLAHSSTSAAAAGKDLADVAAEGNGFAPGSPQGGTARSVGATVLVKTPRWGKASSTVGSGGSSGAKGPGAAGAGAGAGAGGGDSGRIKSPESILGLREIGLEGWNATSRHWERTHSDE